MNEKIINIADSLTLDIRNALELRDKVSIDAGYLGVKITAFSSGDLYIVQIGDIIESCRKIDSIFAPVLNAIKRAIKDQREVFKSTKLAEYTRDSIKEETKDIRDTMKRIMHNVREIEACASAIPKSVKENGKCLQNVYDLRQVILKNRYEIEDELENIKDIVTEMF